MRSLQPEEFVTPAIYLSDGLIEFVGNLFKFCKSLCSLCLCVE